MLSLPQPEVICTHESDLDGFVSGLLLVRLATHLFGEEPMLQAWNYQGWKNRSMSEPLAWVSDFTFEARLDRPGWLIFDHHVHNQVPRYAKLVHSRTQSAAALVYDYCRQAGLQNETLDRLVHLTDIGDLWRSDDAEFELALDYASLVKEYGFWNLHKVVDGNPERLLNHPLLEVMAVKRRVENPIGLAWAKANVEPISTDVGIVQTSIGDTNLIVHQLLDLGVTPYKVLVTLFPKANRTMVASFRSLGGEAIGAAARLQGGGHPNAAGATLPRSVTDTDSAIEYLRDVFTSFQGMQTSGSLQQPFADLKL